MSFQSDIASSGQTALNSVLWRHRVLLSIVLLHLVCGLTISLVLGTPFESGTLRMLRTQLKIMIPLFLVILLFWRFGWTAVRVRPKRPIHWFAADMRRILLDSDRIASGVTAFLCVALFSGTFVFVKDMIPQIMPFSWDPAFAALDRALHGGTDPWRLLLPVFGSPQATSALNAAYHLWFFLMYFCVFWACFDTRNIEKSATFLIAWILAWVLGGNAIALLLSSAGPVYYQVMGFGDTFAAQMDRLHAINEISRVWALDVQDMLLDGYLNDGPVRGISAMPSMHVGSSVVLTLFCFSHRRWLGWLMVAFTATIMIGSVHLAWHYAIDGYLAVAVALGCWALARALIRRFPLES